jgi:hypothetical protein
VIFTVVNGDDDTVYIQRCGDRVTAAVERWRGDGPKGPRWGQYNGDACLAIYSMVPPALGPQAKHVGQIPGLPPGRYRLRLRLHLDGSVARTSASNAFVVA